MSTVRNIGNIEAGEVERHVGRAVGEGGPGDRRDDIGHATVVDLATRSERTEVDARADSRRGIDGRRDVSARLTLDERLDGELELLHDWGS